MTDERDAVSWGDDEEPDEIVQALLALDVPEDVAARHLAMLAEPRSNVLPLRRRRTALRATVGGLALGTALVAGAGVAAASTALPGDPLYGLKNAREHVQLAMARHGDSRAELELKLARTRLGEAAALLQHGHTDRAIETLARADAALASARAQGGDRVDLAVDDELNHRVDILGDLLAGGLPDTAADAARDALGRAIARGAHPTRPTHPAAPADHGRPSDVPSATPSAKPTDHPTHPAHPSGHPTGKPTEIPSRRP